MRQETARAAKTVVAAWSVVRRLPEPQPKLAAKGGALSCSCLQPNEKTACDEKTKQRPAWPCSSSDLIVFATHGRRWVNLLTTVKNNTITTKINATSLR